MAFYRCSGGSSTTYEDGNDIYYPIGSPSQDDKLYKEADVSAIAYALGRSLKISEMAGAVTTIVEQGGIINYSGTRAVVLAECSILPLSEG